MNAIPQRLHRIWLNPPIPCEFQSYGRQWRDLHPTWEIIDWTGVPPSLLPLTNQHAWDMAPATDRWRWRSDLLRLELLWAYGGLYVDMDVQPLRPVDEVLAGRSCVVATSSNRGPGGRPVVSNAVLAAVPSHPFIRRAIHALPDRLAWLPPGTRTARATGPWHLQAVLDEGRWPDVTVLDPWLFYPQSNRDRDAGRPPDLTRAYAWHRWATTRAPCP